MRSAQDKELIPLNPEIERTCRRNRKERRQELLQQRRMADDNRNRDLGPVDQQPKTLRDYIIPTADGVHSSIVRPPIQANNFEIKLGVIQMLQNNQFGGLPHEDPNIHIANFLKICDTFSTMGVLQMLFG